MAHGINANVLRRWRQLARQGQATAAKTGDFIALPSMAAAVETRRHRQTSASNGAVAWSPRPPLDTLVLVLPWQRTGETGVITVV